MYTLTVQAKESIVQNIMWKSKTLSAFPPVYDSEILLVLVLGTLKLIVIIVDVDKYVVLLLSLTLVVVVALEAQRLACTTGTASGRALRGRRATTVRVVRYDASGGTRDALRATSKAAMALRTSSSPRLD